MKRTKFCPVDFRYMSRGGYGSVSFFARTTDRPRAVRNASGISRRAASTVSYKNARSAKGKTGRIVSKTENRYASSSTLRTVGSSSPVTVYRPWPLRLTSPSRTNRVKAKVIDERVASGIAVMISRADTVRPAAFMYSYTRWMTALVSRNSDGSGPFVNNLVLPVVAAAPFSGRAA